MSSKFLAWVMRQGEENKPRLELEELDKSDIRGDGEILVRVLYSTLNYKDGMILGGNIGGIVRDFPHVPGIDFVGEVESSEDERYQEGDLVILTGWGVGERYWGGYSQYARVKGDFLVRLPSGLSPERAMALGTAGFTAMLCVQALESHGMSNSNGSILVTGAAGGVGSVSVMILSALGYEVTALSGREHLKDDLKKIGASEVISREVMLEGSAKPLERQHWGGCIDTVGGEILSRVFRQMRTNTSVAACGLAGGANINTSVMPFILRGVNLLGINSVEQPYAVRVSVWDRLTEVLAGERLDEITSHCELKELPVYANKILKGEVFGRLVVGVG